MLIELLRTTCPDMEGMLSTKTFSLSHRIVGVGVPSAGHMSRMRLFSGTMM